MASDYEKAHQTYRAIVKAAQGGDAKARSEKAAAMNEIRKIEREAARAGTILSATYHGDKVVVRQDETNSKRSLQEEYIRKADGDTIVSIADKAGEAPKEQTLREWHRKRLLGKRN